MVTISDVAHAYKVAGKSASLAIPLGHIQQLICAALGYQSLAAYQASELEPGYFDEVAHVVFDYDLLERRAQELQIPYSSDNLKQLMSQAFAAAVPAAAQYQSEADLSQGLRDYYQGRILNSGWVTGRIAETNGEGIDEIYLEDDDYSFANLPPNEFIDIEFGGHVAMEISEERPYCGHIINFRATLSLCRAGKRCLEEPHCQVTWAEVQDWSGEDHEDEGPPLVSLAQALADQLGVTLVEAEELEDAPYMDNDSDDGLTYSHIFDFEDHASPALAKKLLARYGALQIHVPVGFFERVHRSHFM